MWMILRDLMKQRDGEKYVEKFGKEAGAAGQREGYPGSFWI